MMPTNTSAADLNLLILSLVLGFGLVNIMTFAAFAVDKRRASARDWRIPERSLLILATFGGWPAAKLAQHILRHKTRKQPFRRLLNLSILPVLGLATALASQDVDWQALIAKAQSQLGNEAPAQISDLPEQTVALAVPEIPAKPVVRNINKTSATKDTLVTDSPDLPKRFGPSSKKPAWKAR